MCKSACCAEGSGKMPTEQEYRRTATECLAKAAQASTPEERGKWLAMGLQWIRLAEQAAKKGEPAVPDQAGSSVDAEQADARR